jgi:hypothetical protein
MKVITWMTEFPPVAGHMIECLRKPDLFLINWSVDCVMTNNALILFFS